MRLMIMKIVLNFGILLCQILFFNKPKQNHKGSDKIQKKKKNEYDILNRFNISMINTCILISLSATC